MRAIKNFLIIFLLVLALFFFSYYYGAHKAKQELRKEREVITSQVILDKVQDQYFLVTKTLLVDDAVEIAIKGSDSWKDAFTGDKISAQGTVRIDIGVDLDYFTANDIVIDHINRHVVVYLPEARILDASIKDDIDVMTKKGLWTSVKDLFANDDGEDYNRAARELIAQAETAAKDQKDVFVEAREAGVDLVELVVESYLPEYELEIKEK